MVTPQRSNVGEMQEMFAAVSELYARYWNEYFHFALFEGEESWEAAFARTHERYLRALRVPDSTRILELACGRGGFSELMACSTTGDVLGIDISDAQLARARQRRRPNLSFEQKDVMEVHTLPGKFDAVAFMDAACYLPDRALAIERVASVMRSGARLLWIDWCRSENVNEIQEELVLAPFMRYWAIPSLETGQSYARLFAPFFHLVEVEDLNHCTRRNWEFAYDSALRALQEVTVENLPALLGSTGVVNPQQVRLLKEQFPAALYIRAGFDAGFLRYKYHLLERR